jgi:hypothetical protein
MIDGTELARSIVAKSEEALEGNNEKRDNNEWNRHRHHKRFFVAVDRHQ